MNKHTKVIPEYKLRQTNIGLFLTEVSAENELEEDISYLQQYMSLNLEEYMCKHKPDDSGDYTSLKDKLESVQRGKHSEKDKLTKTLHKLDIGGEKVYVFIEDLKTLSELDEIVFTKFINRDMRSVHEKHGIED